MRNVNMLPLIIDVGNGMIIFYKNTLRRYSFDQTIITRIRYTFRLKKWWLK